MEAIYLMKDINAQRQQDVSKYDSSRSNNLSSITKA